MCCALWDGEMIPSLVRDASLFQPCGMTVRDGHLAPRLSSVVDEAPRHRRQVRRPRGLARAPRRP